MYTDSTSKACNKSDANDAHVSKFDLTLILEGDEKDAVSEV